MIRKLKREDSCLFSGIGRFLKKVKIGFSFWKFWSNVILERSELIIFMVLKVLFISFMCCLIGGRIELL